MGPSVRLTGGVWGAGAGGVGRGVRRWIGRMRWRFSISRPGGRVFGGVLRLVGGGRGGGRGSEGGKGGGCLLGSVLVSISVSLWARAGDYSRGTLCDCGDGAARFATAGRSVSAREHGIGVGLYVHRAMGAVRGGMPARATSFFFHMLREHRRFFAQFEGKGGDAVTVLGLRVGLTISRVSVGGGGNCIAGRAFSFFFKLACLGVSNSIFQIREYHRGTRLRLIMIPRFFPYRV